MENCYKLVPIERGRLSVTNLSLEKKKTLPMFSMNVPVVIKMKVKRCERTLLFKPNYYQGYMSLRVKVGKNYSFLPAHSLWWSNNQGLLALLLD